MELQALRSNIIGMKSKLIYCFFILVVIFQSNAYCETKSYLVVFEEGYYKKKEYKLYEARVTVYQNNKKLRTNEELRGSTLPNRFLYYVDKNRPIVEPGEYRFDVERSSRFGKALRLNGGKYVETMNPNPCKHNQYIADGIWVHSGRKAGPVKGSIGCLTIDPNNWDEFIKLFPSAGDWKKEGFQGKIVIKRYSDNSSNKLSSPSNLRIR